MRGEEKPSDQGNETADAKGERGAGSAAVHEDRRSDKCPELSGIEKTRRKDGGREGERERGGIEISTGRRRRECRSRGAAAASN